MLKKLLRKLSEYPRLRVLVILGVIVLVIVMIFELFTPKSSSFTPPPIPSSQIPNGPLNQNAHTTQIGTAQREQQSKNLQQKALENQVASGGDLLSLSKLFPASGNTSNNTNSTNAANGDNASNTGVVKSPEQVLAQNSVHDANSNNQNNPNNPNNPNNVPPISPLQLQKNLQAQGLPNAPRYQGYPNNQPTPQDQMASQMRSTMDGYSGQWALPVQSQVQGVGSADNEKGLGLPTLPPVNLIRAGTIMFAVLQNALSSDQTGTPVLAQIAAGQFRGAELIGTFSTSSDDKLVIQFNQMILKNYPNPISITAYAIDPVTAENALASGVNHHYLERYGSLFAASMLQGFGNAYSNYQNPCYGTNNCFIDGSVQKTSVTTETAMYQGLGQIGTNVASQVQNNFNRPDTIYLKQGSGMGILFMQNVTTGTDNQPTANPSKTNLPPSAVLGNPQAVKAAMSSGSAS